MSFSAPSRVATGIVSNKKTIQGKGISFEYSQIDRTGAKWKIFKEKFKFHAERVLSEQVCALCHELAKESMPTRKNGHFTSDEAKAKLEKENAELANIAFKPVTLKSPAWWILAGYTDVAKYVVDKTGFQFKNETLQRWYKNGQYEILASALMDWGKYPRPKQQSIPSHHQILEKASYSEFVRWKSLYKKQGAKKPFWVKNEASILKISKEKSIYNYSSICINGWLKASSQLGHKLPSGVKRVNWPYGKKLGWGYARITEVSSTNFKLTFTNKYGNLNGIFYGSTQQGVYNTRKTIAKQEIDKLLKTMLKYWKSIKV